MNAVDTNILVYVQDPRDPAKQKVAAELVTRLSDGVLLWQVMCEYVAASRKLASLGFGQQQAFEDIRELSQLWTVALPSIPVIDRAERLLAAYSLSFWDAMLMAACQDAGVAILFSEDFSAYSQVDGLQVVNPFRAQS